MSTFHNYDSVGCTCPEKAKGENATYCSVMYKVAVPNSWSFTRSLVAGDWKRIPSTGAEKFEEITTIIIKKQCRYATGKQIYNFNKM